MNSLLSIRPIPDRAARPLFKILRQHRNRGRAKRCKYCQVPNCAPAIDAHFELIMAGRLPESELGGWAAS